MADYEKLGVFYLGRYYDLAARQRLPDLLLYNSNDLLTHALCVGMTGSGKTGLCLSLIEEAAVDGIPALLIDPKGDLANLLLTFPELRPTDFEPWVNPDAARKEGLAVADYAAKQAERWRSGLAEWDQDGERIRRLQAAAEFAIYTPGSNAGLPVSILSSFAAPPAALASDAELLRERIQTTVSGLLGLLGVEADPSRSREAVFLANIIQQAWAGGRDLDLGTLIHEIQTPSLARIGVMDVETFYPAKERFALATALNGLLASPGFSGWLEGEPLDIAHLLHTPAGKPRIAIFSIAHLGEAERMFFTALLLNQVLGWMRTQSGTTSLRALLYMDEIFGYFPPVANPPSKLPLLTLLKQARAFGVGVVLATQNPVDLDYKGLANIGTWFLGRLQTERDKQRVLDGLEGAAGAQGSAFDRSTMEQTLASLGSRVFLLHNVHEEGASVFESRWCLSYLRGPLSRPEIKRLTDSRRATEAGARVAAAPAPARVSAAPAAARISRAAPASAAGPARPRPGVEEPTPLPPASAPLPERAEASLATLRPALPPGIPQFFLPARWTSPSLVYRPMLIGAARVRFTDARAKVDVTEDVVLLTPIHDDAVPVEWAEAQESDVDPNALATVPASGAGFAALPAPASQVANFTRWSKQFIDVLAGTRKLTLFKSTELGQLSLPRETEREFRVRLRQSAREKRDAAAAKLRAKYAPRIATLNERLRRAAQAVDRETGQARQAKLSAMLSFGTTMLGAFLGRKVVSATNLGRAGSAVRGVGRSVEQEQDVARARETVDAIERELADLDARFREETAALETGFDAETEPLETIEIAPKKSGISPKLVALVWAPHDCETAGVEQPAY